MNPIAITVIAAVALISLFSWVAFRQGKQISAAGDIESRWKKVDMEAFLNLVDPAEETYLRRNLSATEFANIQRHRVRVMWEYLARLSANSKLMMQAGQMVQHHGRAEQMQEATQLVAAASRMRMLIFAVDAYLIVRFLLPQTQDPVRTLVGKYDELTQMFTQTCGSQLVYSRSLAG
jgi:hypothetical protein